MIDRDRMEDVKRKRLLVGIGAAIVLITIIVSIVLSRLAVRNVDTKAGIDAIRGLEKEDVAEIEAQIQDIEKQEKLAEEEYRNRPLAEKFAYAVIMGDSITTGFLEYEILDTSHVVAERGVHLNELADMIDTLESLKPQTVFLALGLNDVSATEGDTDTFIKSYRAILTDIKGRLPDAKIYINGILPVQEKAIEKYPAYAYISSYNEVLADMCEEEKVTFVDNSELVKEEYYEEDGEHMKVEFYSVWAGHMAEVAEI